MDRVQHHFVVRTAGSAAASAIALGVVVLIGWAADAKALTSVIPGLPSMKPWTAIAFLASGLSLGVRCLAVAEPRARRLGVGAAAVALGIGGLTLVEYATGAYLTFDRWLFAEALRYDPAYPTGRMAIPTALGFTGVGAALLLAHDGQPGARLQWPSFFTFGVALVTLTGYLYEVPVLGRFVPHAYGPFTNIALHTSVGLLILGATIPCTDPTTGLVGLLRDRGLAGRWARWVMPWVIVVPLTGSWIRLVGERRGLYPGDVGTAVFTVLNVLIMAGLVWAVTARLARSVRDRDRARSVQRTVERSFRHMVEAMQEGVWLLDREATVTYVNQRLAELLGGPPDQIVGHKLWDFVAPEDRAAAERRFEDRRQGIRDSFDFRMRRLDGSPRWVLVSSNPFMDEHGRVGGTLATLTDIHERKRVEDRQQLLVNELDHRVKNTLATVLALLDETLETADSPEAFREAFDGRVRAMARTHEALARRRWADLPLAEVVELALSAVADPARSELCASGPAARIRAAIVLPLLLALNELATNAVKHGSLSRAGGRLEVRWRTTARDWIELDWSERDGPPTQASPPPGAGLELIRDLVRGQLRGTLELVFAEVGLDARLAFPLAPPSGAGGGLISVEAASRAG